MNTNGTWECKKHLDETPKIGWTYLGLMDYTCPICKESATMIPRTLDKMHYWQNGDNGRICACLKKLSGNWEEISFEAYCAISDEMMKNDSKPVR